MLIRRLRTHKRFATLLALFILAVLIQQAVLPPMEGGDEYLHFNTVQFLAAEGRLPDRTQYQTNSTRQQSGQPPLVYAAAAVVVRVFNLPLIDGLEMLDRYESLKNFWYTPPNAWNRTDNRNLHFQGAGEQSFVTPEVEQVDRVIRVVALGFGVLAVIGAYGAAREVFTQESWALVATAIFAFTPQMVHVSAFVTTDVGVTAFSALTLWQTLKLLRLGATPTRLMLIGVLAGLAALSKVSGLLILPAVGVAVLLDWYKRKLPLSRFIVNGVIAAVPFMLLFVPWMVYGIITFNDPFGTLTHLRPGYYFDTPLTLIEVVPLLPEVYLGYWGKLASAVYLHPVTYTLLGTLPLLAVIGVVVGWRNYNRHKTDTVVQFSKSRGKSSPPPNPLPITWRGGTEKKSSPYLFINAPTIHFEQGLVLVVLAAGSAIGLLHWLQTIQFITGRLAYMAHVAVAIGITAGLRMLISSSKSPNLENALQTYAVGVMAVSGVILSAMSIYTAYAPPIKLTRETLPTLQGNAYDFENTIRFLGYSQENFQPTLSGDSYPITLCWEVLNSTERPAAFSVKIVKDGNIIADRTSVHGMGRYFSPLWQPGDLFCDAVDVPIQQTPQAGQTYDILLVLLDARTQAVDWQATTVDEAPVQFPFIGQVQAP